MSEKLAAFYVVECVTHNLEKWDVKERKSVKAKLYLFDPARGVPMSPDVMWLQSITREDSGTFFTTSVEKAVRFDSEDEADDKVTEIVLELGYLPSDVISARIEPSKEEE